MIPSRLRKVNLNLPLTCLSIITISCFILIFFETVPYLKFIVTSSHISTGVLQLVIIFLWAGAVFYYGRKSLKYLLITLLLSVTGESIAKVSLNTYREIRSMMAHPFISYDDKMELAYSGFHGFYPAMKEVVRLTPPDSTLIIPPQMNPWEIEGNVPMVSYFVYPRRVVNMGLNDLTLPDHKGRAYLLIAKGSADKSGSVDYYWPKIPILGARIWQIDAQKHVSKEIGSAYDPATHHMDWGLIEVKYE